MDLQSLAWPGENTVRHQKTKYYNTGFGGGSGGFNAHQYTYLRPENANSVAQEANRQDRLLNEPLPEKVEKEQHHRDQGVHEEASENAEAASVVPNSRSHEATTSVFMHNLKRSSTEYRVNDSDSKKAKSSRSRVIF